MGEGRVAVIGGGIIGCTAAALLAEAGRNVTLVEATAIAAGASGRNSGAIQHPFDDGLLPLHRETLAMYRQLADADAGFDLPVEPAGILLLTDDPAAARSRAADLGATFPELEPDVLDPTALAAVEPALAGGWTAVRVTTGYPGAPDAATSAFASRAVLAGAVLRIGRGARPWVEDGHLRGVALDDGEQLPVDAVLVAGGPWTPDILDQRPYWPPISRTWGVTVLVSMPNLPQHLLEEGVVHTINAPAGVAGSLFSLIGVGEVATVGSTFLAERPDPETVAPLLIARGAAFVPALVDAKVIDVRICARPQSADGRPFIGPVPGVKGLWVCAGHGPWGISTGPASASMVVDLILGRADRISPALRSDRPVQ